MENGVLMNVGWLFKDSFCEAFAKQTDFPGFERVNLPHTVKETAYNCFSHAATSLITTYVKQFTLAENQKGKRAILVFEGVMTYLDLYVNGQKVGFHKGGYTKASFDITSYIKDGENTVVVAVDSNERDDIPPFGGVIDYLTFGGIYRDVYMYFLEEAYIANILFRYDLKDGVVAAYPEVFTDNADAAFSGFISYEVFAKDSGVVLKEAVQKIDVPAGRGQIILNREIISDVKLWDIESPNLYTVKAKLVKDGATLDTYSLRTGFRTMESKPEGFFLNGRRVQIVGQDRHQSFPYRGYAMGKSAQEKDADILLEFGLNTVRTSHYPQSKYFLDRCDEIGLLCFEEIPGWQFIGGDEYKRVVLQDVELMITTDFNHPSIFIWGVRLNESLDDDALYTKTNALARKLDPSRPTGGVRYQMKSNMLEDVYTLNDFTHEGGEAVLCNQQNVTKLTKKVPYLVTEYMGHTYPTKNFDNELRRDEHVRRHARILSENLRRTKDSMGAIGWCAWDYNTHGDFGAGDKICYHGIFDMFRMPKYAAYVYRSQKSPEKEIILEPATCFARGEKDLYGVMPFLVLTNCDYIEVKMLGESLGYFFPSEKFYGLPHPPIEVDVDIRSRWNTIWQDGEIIGYVNDKPVATSKFARDPYLAGLVVTQDAGALLNDRVDETRFTCTFVNQLGKQMPFYNGVLQFETEGDVEVIGPKIVATIGGRIGFWVKSKATGAKGTAKVTVKAPATDLPAQVFNIELI